MEKTIVSLGMVALLSGCSLFQTKPTEPARTENTSYKKYDIVMPKRPVLNLETLSPNPTQGQVARAYELDLLNLTEYAMELENILNPIVNGPDTTEIKPLEEPAKEEPKHWWNRFF